MSDFDALQVCGQLLMSVADDSNTKVRSADHEPVGTPSNSTCHTPDGIVYHDAAGVRREIKNMTVDTYEKVMDLYGRGDFVALSGIATKYVNAIIDG